MLKDYFWITYRLILCYLITAEYFTFFHNLRKKAEGLLELRDAIGGPCSAQHCNSRL